MKGPGAKNILFFLLVPVLFFAGLETAARLLAAPPEDPVMGRPAAAITAEGLPALAEILAYDPVLFWRLAPNLAGKRVAGRIGNYPVDFTVSTNGDGARLVSEAPEKTCGTAQSPKRRECTRRILVLGDSASFGLGVSDAEAWPSLLDAMIVEKRGSGWGVCNMAVPGHTTFQGKRYLEERGEALRPYVVIAGFWANDKASWMGASDLQTMRMVERWEANRWFFERCRLAWAMNGLYRSLQPEPQARPRLNEAEFLGCLESMAAWGREHETPVAFLVWPSRVQIAEKQEELHGYQALVAKAAKAADAVLINPAPRFIQAGGDLFVDDYHGNAAGCALAADAVWEALEPVLEKRQLLEGPWK